MKKSFLVLGTLIILLMTNSIAFGETLNTYEKEIIEVAKGQFEYNGLIYKVDQDYIDQLIEYLSAEGIDLTEEQKEEIITKVYSEIATGVKEGYLVPVEKPSKTEKTTEIPAETKVSPPLFAPEQQKDAPVSVPADTTTIIKNTGFNMNTTILFVLGAVMLLLLCIIKTLKSDYFAHTDE